MSKREKGKNLNDLFDAVFNQKKIQENQNINQTNNIQNKNYKGGILNQQSNNNISRKKENQNRQQPQNSNKSNFIMKGNNQKILLSTPSVTGITSYAYQNTNSNNLDKQNIIPFSEKKTPKITSYAYSNVNSFQSQGNNHERTYQSFSNENHLYNSNSIDRTNKIIINPYEDDKILNNEEKNEDNLNFHKDKLNFNNNQENNNFSNRYNINKNDYSNKNKIENNSNYIYMQGGINTDNFDLNENVNKYKINKNNNKYDDGDKKIYNSKGNQNNEIFDFSADKNTLSIDEIKSFIYKNHKIGSDAYEKIIQDLNNKISYNEYDDVNNMEEKVNEKMEMKILYSKTYEMCVNIITKLQALTKFFQRSEIYKNFERNALNFIYELSITELYRMDASLPIYAKKFSLIKLIDDNRCSIVFGETGSGKSTQIAQYIYENNMFKKIEKISNFYQLMLEPNMNNLHFNINNYIKLGHPSITEYEEAEFAKLEYLNKFIAISQPRKLATKTLSLRVAKEMNLSNKSDVICRLGKKDFEKNIKKSHIIEFCTDTVLVEEILQDKLLKNYSHILIDEAHERNIYTDIVLGLLKYVLEVRPDLKIIITSATMDEKLFSNFFNSAPIIRIKGRVYPLKINYHGRELDSSQDVQHHVTKTVSEIINKLDSFEFGYINEIDRYTINNPNWGHILIFTSGLDEINKLTYQLNMLISGTNPRKNYGNKLNQEGGGKIINNALKKIKILPLHGKLTTEEQMEVFEDGEYIKIILATRIAETSITINNVKYVIDVGYDKESVYDPIKKITLFRINPISQSSANQRAGRACRTSPGECYRLYPFEYFREMPKYKIPEIKRSNLSIVVLKLKIFRIDDVKNFSFIEHPGEELINDSIEELKLLQALDENEKITLLGKEMADLPTDPWYSKILIESGIRNCQDESIKIISMLSQHNIFFEGKLTDKKKLEEMKLEFADETGDLIMMLNIFNKCWEIYNQNQRPGVNNDYNTGKGNSKIKLVNYCKDKFINIKGIFSAIEFYQEIKMNLKGKDIISKIIDQKKRDLAKNFSQIQISNEKKKLKAQDMLEIYNIFQGGNSVNTNNNDEPYSNNKNFEINKPIFNEKIGIINQEDLDLKIDKKNFNSKKENFESDEYNFNIFSSDSKIEQKDQIMNQDKLNMNLNINANLFNCFKTEDNIKINILKCFLSSCFQNLSVYSTNEEIGYTLIREHLPIKLHDQTSFKLHQNFPKWIFCINIVNGDNLNNGSLTRIASKCEIEWIEEVVPKIFLEYYNIKNYDKLPIYNSIIFENVPSFYLSAIKNPINFKTILIEEFLIENKFFTTLNFEKNLIKIWSINSEDYIRDKWKEFYRLFKNEITNMTKEFVYLDNRRIIFNSGLQISEILTDEEYISIKLDISSILSEQIIKFVESKKLIKRKIKKVSNNFDKTDELTFNCPDSGTSNKVWSLILDYLEGRKIPEDRYKFETITKSKKITEEALFSNKIKINVKVIFFMGYSLIKGFIRGTPALIKRLKKVVLYPELKNFIQLSENEEDIESKRKDFWLNCNPEFHLSKDPKNNRIINFQMGFLMDDQFDLFEKFYQFIPGLKMEDIAFYRCQSVEDVEKFISIDVSNRKRFYELYTQVEKNTFIPRSVADFTDYLEKCLKIELSQENIEVDMLHKTNQLLGNVTLKSGSNFKGGNNESFIEKEKLMKFISFNVKTLKFAYFIKEKLDKKMGLLGYGKIHVLVSYKVRIEILEEKFCKLEKTLQQTRLKLTKNYPNTLSKIINPSKEMLNLKNKNVGMDEINKINNPIKHFINISSETSMQDVIECNEEFEKIIKGRVLMEYDYNTACNLFIQFSFLNRNQWEEKYNCYIENILDLKEIRICGDPENIEKGLPELYHLIENSKYENRYIDYKGKNISNLLMKKKKFMEEIKKKHIIDYDFNLMAKRLNVSGLIENVKRAIVEIEENIIENNQFTVQKNINMIIFNNSLSANKNIEENENLCGICYSEKFKPLILIECYHSFCTNCLNLYLEESIHNSSNFPLVCPRNECKKFLTLRDIQTIIKPDRLNLLMQRGLENFISKNRKKFSFCPKVSCKNILLLKNLGPYNSTKCELCNHIYCVECLEEFHPKKTCEENKVETREIFKDLKIKRCPECAFPIEKKEGCNHIQCNCKVHFCWLCMEKFKDDQETYRHLNSVHGSMN